MKNRFVYGLVAIVLAAACTTTPEIDLTTYAPVIDTFKVDVTAYGKDLAECRQLGQKAYASYEAQRQRERKEREERISAFLRGTAGAGSFGSAMAGGSAAMAKEKDAQMKKRASRGILSTSAVADASQVDYNRMIHKFGPTKIIDNCMTRRGYQIFSQAGLGGD